MPKQVDNTPIQVTRTNRTRRFEIYFTETGALIQINAFRSQYSTSGGASVGNPTESNTISLVLGDFTQPQKTQLNQVLSMVENIIDSKDS
jgi:hypothetical protein